MNFIVVGTNHKYSPIKLREEISFSRKRLHDVFSFLKETGVLKGAVILSTCNRAEIYASTDLAERGIREIKSFLSRFYEVDEKELYPYLYIYKGVDAVRHLFRVASGLDSLVLGELQISGQVKSAFYESVREGFTGSLLEEAFLSASLVTRKVHDLTRISEGKVSVGSVAVDFIKERIGTLRDKNILIIGVGKVTGLVLRYLEKEDSNVVFISNRTFKKAESLARKIKAKAVRFDNLREYLPKADIVITATKSPHFIIKKKDIESLGRLLIVDLALPRDVDPEVKEVEGIELFDLENLTTVIQKNKDRKKIEALKAEEIVNIEAGRLWRQVSESEQEKVLSR